MWKPEVRWFVLAVFLIVAILVVSNNHWHRFVAPDLTGARLDGPDPSPAPATWVGPNACGECHAKADSAWTGSDHDLAMQVPGSTTITADFSNSTFTHFGVTTTFFRRDDKYMVHTDGPDGVVADFEVAYVFGYFPLEQFLIRFPNGRLQALNVCWDTTPAAEGGQRWFHLYPDDETPADDLFHWTGMLQNWNYMCAECHSTNVQRNYDTETNTYATTWSELDVSCEACHGPGSRHITWERAQAQGLHPRDESGTRGLVVSLKSPDQGQWIFEADKPTAVRSEPLASRVEVESCARCHARRTQLTTDYEYGRSFYDHYRLVLLDEDLYAADGQNQDENYVYGSFLQSKMYAAGVTCSDCHDYHATGTRGNANLVCARCHRTDVFDTPNHHFHQTGKGGDSCLDCHQQARKVMVVDARRDHSFRIPRPDLSLEIGTPNACNDCHDDKPLQWAQDAIVQWYGAERLQGPHYAVALHAGRIGSPGALARLRYLVGAEDYPAIVRATALSLMPRYAAVSEVSEAVEALSHVDPLIRGAAVRALESSPFDRQLTLALPLVNDTVRDVRIAAAGVVSRLPRSVTNQANNSAVSHAHEVWRNHLSTNAERPENRLGLAAQNVNLGLFAAAEKQFRAALELAPRFAPSYVNFADFLKREGRQTEALELLRTGLNMATETAVIHHAMGLQLVALQDLPEALTHLGEAVTQRPQSARYSYVYAVGLHDSGQVAKSLQVLEEVLDLAPWDRDSLLAMALYALEQEQPQRGLVPVRRLAKLDPGNPEIGRLVREIEAAANRD